ncbi:MAG: cytochrome C [Burkholderiales bacterium]|nr:cytochrome C [Burkholderiales bacterium]
MLAFCLSAGVASVGGGADMVDPADVPDVLIQRDRPPVPRVQALRTTRNCQGCHGHEGFSVTEVPRLRDRVGFFTHTPEGRAYLVQVPNVLQSHLSDARLAAMLNWMLARYSRDQLIAPFEPYTAEEVQMLRRHRLDSVVQRRHDVIAGLVQAGVIPDAGVLAFSLEPGRY